MRTTRILKTSLLALVVIGTAQVHADRLELRTGDVFTGKILRVSEDDVSIQLAGGESGGGILTFRLSGVRLIRKNNLDGEPSTILLDRRGPSPESRDPRTASLEPLRNRDVPAEKPAAGPVAPPATPAGDSPPLKETAGSETVSPPGAPLVGERQSAVKHRFSVAPPRGFAPWEEGRSPTVPLAFKDAATDSTFLVEWRASSETAKKLKNKALRACAEQFSTFHVVREPWARPRRTRTSP